MENVNKTSIKSKTAMILQLVKYIIILYNW